MQSGTIYLKMKPPKTYVPICLVRGNSERAHEQHPATVSCLWGRGLLGGCISGTGVGGDLTVTSDTSSMFYLPCESTVKEDLS